MSTADISQIQMDALTKAAEKYEAAENEADKIAALREYDAAYSARYGELREALKAVESSDREEEATLKELEAEAQRLQHQLDATYFQSSNSTTGPTLGSVTPSAGYHAFLCERSATLAQLTVVRSTLQAFKDSVDQRTPLSIQGDWTLGKTLLTDSEWEPFNARLGDAVDRLNREAASMSAGSPSEKNIEPLYKLLREVRQVRPLARVAADELAARENSTRDVRDEIDNERARLLTWCRQQKSNLDSLVDADHIQEFCASVLQNIPVMEENYEALYEMTLPLLPDDGLQKRLLECNEVWLNLQVTTYERLRQALLEIHPKSKLEDEVREYSNYTTRVGEFLDAFYELVTGPSEPGSEHIVQPIIEHCEAVKGEFPMFDGLPKQLHDFSLRMECLREAYSNLRRAVLSRLTFLPSPVPALTASMRRKEEYVARMKELKKWVDVKSQGETWREIHERILGIKSLIESEQATLLEAKAIQEKKNGTGNGSGPASPTSPLNVNE